MDRFIALFVFLIALFFNSDMAVYLGFSQRDICAYSLLFIFFIYKYTQNTKKISLSNYSIYLIVLSVSLIAIKFVLGMNYFKNVFDLVIIPLTIIICSDWLNKNEIKKLRLSIILFYIVECGVAILERIISYRFFDTIYTSEMNIYNIQGQEAWQFRSTALLGHPLTNAMAVSIIMSFICFSNMKITFKTILLAIGFISLFCFNVRGALIVDSIIILPYFVNNLFNKNKFYFSLIIIILLALYISANKSVIDTFGGRLFNDNLIDGGMSRVNILGFYNYISIDDLIFGSPNLYAELLTKTGLYGVESGLVYLIIQYGFIFALLFLLFMLNIQLELLNKYNKYQKFSLIFIFYSIGLMNPNLGDYLQWILFFFCYYAFKPQNKKTIYAKVQFKTNRNNNISCIR
jgi:hypothetical protein